MIAWKGSFPRFPPAVPLGLLAIFLLTTGIACRKKAEPAAQTQETQETATQQETLATVDPASVEDLEANLNLAREKATSDFRKDAVLHHIQVRLPADLKVGGATETYTFGSPGDPVNWWTISVAQKTGRFVRALIPQEDYLGELPALKLQYFKVSYPEAFQTAEAAGGKDFRTKNPGAEITLNLLVGEPKAWLWWLVEYTAAQDSLKVRIDPDSGQVYDEQGNPKATATGESEGESSELPATQ